MSFTCLASPRVCLAHKESKVIVASTVHLVALAKVRDFFRIDSADTTCSLCQLAVTVSKEVVETMAVLVRSSHLSQE